MKILLTGCRGQVGSALRPLLSEFGAVTAHGRDEVDFTDRDALRRCLDTLEPGLIVNAAAWTDVDRAELHRAEAFAINAEAPRLLAEWAASAGAALVHYSTDYVFDGGGSRPHPESEAPAPLNVYGLSKLAGDDAVLGSGGSVLVLRSSWIYASEGRNFLRTMLHLGAEREILSVVADQIGAPTPAGELARITASILRKAEGDLAGFLREQGGLVNVSTLGEASWREFAETIFDNARRRGWSLRVSSVRAISSSEYPVPARRPLNSRLDLSRLVSRFGIRPPHWRDALDDVMEELDNKGYRPST